MRHEIIRMEHVNISRPGRHEIEDLNQIICRGYSMGAAGVENSKEILADFFEGKGTLARGRIYLDGEPWKPEGKRDFEDAGIFVISKDTVYMDSLDVSENLFLLRRNSLRKIRLNEKALHIQGRALLEKYDLPYAADEHSSHLKNGDRILIGMVRAITQGARILVLREIVACFPGEERRKLRQFVNRLKQDGITIISIDNRADFTDPFFDEVILFRHHTIYKKICQNEDTWMIDEILKRGLEAADTTIPKARAASGKPQLRPVDSFVWQMFRDGSWQPQISMRAGEILAALGTPGQVEEIWSDILCSNAIQSRFELDGEIIAYKNIQELMKHRIALMEYGNHTEICENLTNEDEAYLRQLLAEYNALTDAQKELVYNYATLLAALEKAGHNPELKNAKPATCTEDGYTGDQVCSVCGEVVKKGEVIPALGHKTQLVGAKAATCTEDGYKVTKCGRCGKELGSHYSIVKALGHQFVETTVDPTCTESGYTVSKCTRCHEEEGERTNLVAPLGHEYKNGVCTRCGAPEPQENGGSSFAAPNYTVTGAETYETSVVDGRYIIAVPSEDAALNAVLGDLRAIKAQGADVVVFRTRSRESSLVIDEMLAMGPDATPFVLAHNGGEARLTINGAVHNELIH